MDLTLPKELLDYLDELDDFIEREIRPLEQENDNIRFFDHRREDARTDWDRGGLPNEEWEDLLREARRRADAAGHYRYAFPAEFGGRDGSNLGMAVIREHLAKKGLGLHCDLQNEHAIVGNNVGLLLMLEHGTDEQKAEWVDGLATGTKGFAFGIITLALPAFAVPLANRLVDLTGGSQGIGVVATTSPEWTGQADDQWRLYLVAAVAAVVFWAVHNLLDGRLGRALAAIRVNEAMAAATGVAVHRYKVVAFTVAGLCGGVAGWLYLVAVQFVSPALLQLNLAVSLLVALVVGEAIVRFQEGRGDPGPRPHDVVGLTPLQGLHGLPHRPEQVGPPLLG